MKLLKGSLIALLIVMILCYGAVTVLFSDDSDHVPVIKCSSNQIIIPCSYSEEDLLRGIKASDQEDGDITEDILVRNFSKFSKPGNCEIKYAVFDSKGQYAEYNRKVVFFDYEAPKITLIEPLVFIKSEEEYTLRDYLIATDSLDGNLTKHIKIESTDVVYKNSGTYTAAVSVKNSFGDSVNLKLPIHVIEDGYRDVEITLKEPLVYVDKDEKIEPKEYIEKVWRGQDHQELPLEECEVEIESKVDYSKPGVYEVSYTIYAYDKAIFGKTWLTVVVGEYGG